MFAPAASQIVKAAYHSASQEWVQLQLTAYILAFSTTFEDIKLVQ